MCEDLAKLIKEDPGNIQRELKRLEKVGFLSSEKQGNTKIYSTNKQFPIFKELQSIVIKSQQQAGAQSAHLPTFRCDYLKQLWRLVAWRETIKDAFFVAEL